MCFNFYRMGWTDEGRFWRKKGWIIRKPVNGSDKAKYQLRKVGSKPGKLETGERDYNTLKEVMIAGNKNIHKKL